MVTLLIAIEEPAERPARGARAPCGGHWT